MNPWAENNYKELMHRSFPNVFETAKSKQRALMARALKVDVRSKGVMLAKEGEVTNSSEIIVVVKGRVKFLKKKANEPEKVSNIKTELELVPKDQRSFKKLELDDDVYKRVKRYQNQKKRSLEQRILIGEFGSEITTCDYEYQSTLMVGEDAFLNGRLNSYSVITDSQCICLTMNTQVFFKIVLE